MLRFIFVCCVILLFVGQSKQQNYLGDYCTTTSGKPGMCEMLSKCTKAKEDLSKNIIPKNCGFQGREPIVCCETVKSSPLTSLTNARSPGDISKEKCREYSKYTTVKTRPPVLLIDVEEEEEYVCHHQVVELIVGGEKANDQEFPHMAAVGYQTEEEIKWLCGGTIISEQFVLTAGHCLVSREFGQAIQVKLGVNRINDRKHAQHLSIIERIPHPKYRSSSHYDDIGLLKMERAAKMSPRARPACLYTRPQVATKRAIAIGFGKTQFAGDSSKDLLKVTLDLFTQKLCSDTYKRQTNRKLLKGILEDSQLCAGSLTEEKDTCQGDSGGPLQIYHTGDDIRCMYDLVGVTSFGKACSGNPGVYTRVSNYIDWIEKNVWPQ